jgi:hypothetical protein
MGLIQDAIRKIRENRAAKKEEKATYERQQGVVKGYEQKQMSNDERELLKWQEQQRQKMITEQLKAVRKQEQSKFWGGHDHNSIDAPNITKDSPNAVKSKGNLFLR